MFIDVPATHGHARLLRGREAGGVPVPSSERCGAGSRCRLQSTRNMFTVENPLGPQAHDLPPPTRTVTIVAATPTACRPALNGSLERILRMHHINSSFNFQHQIRTKHSSHRPPQA